MLTKIRKVLTNEIQQGRGKSSFYTDLFKRKSSFIRGEGGLFILREKGSEGEGCSKGDELIG